MTPVPRFSTGDSALLPVLWLAIKIERRLGDDSAVSALAAQLRKLHPSSKELISMQKGAFDE